MQGQMSPNDAGLTSLSARAKNTQTCIHGLLQQTLHHKEPSLSHAVLRETGVVMKGELMLWPHVEVSIPRLGQSYRTLVSAPGACQPPASAFSLSLGFLCADISFFPSGGTVIGFVVFVLREGINQKGPGESQNTKPCAWGSMFA